MTEQNRKYVKKEIGKLLSGIWRIKGLAKPGVRPAAPNHQEAGRDAWGGTGTAAGENRKTVSIRSILFCEIIGIPGAHDP
jgi:hypothetical protein